MAKAKKGAKAESSTEKAAPKKKGAAKEKAPASFDTTDSVATSRVGGTRITFYGFGAYVGTIRGATHCEWWHDDPPRLKWSTKALIETDLSKNPMAARAGTISIVDIVVDDHRMDGGFTEIGPRFPQGTSIGALWLSDWYWNKLTGNRPPRPATNDARNYELTALLYLDGPFNGRRFVGTHAHVIGKQGPLTNVEIWHPGRSKVRGEQPAGAFWLDLAQVAHPVEPGATEVSSTGDEGALFIDDVTARQIGLRYPKLPPGWGLEFF